MINTKISEKWKFEINTFINRLKSEVVYNNH